MFTKKTQRRLIELIIVDEFTFNPKTNKWYGWSPVNSKRFVKEFPNPKGISGIVALSHSRHYGIVIVKGTIKLNILKYFFVLSSNQWRATEKNNKNHELWYVITERPTRRRRWSDFSWTKQRGNDNHFGVLTVAEPCRVLYLEFIHNL